MRPPRRTLWQRLTRHRLTGRSPAPTPDPFRTLALQDRLSRLSREISVHTGDGSHEFASGFHSRAAMIAYDRTLDEACQAAGIPVPDGDGPTHRILAEAALSQAGWTW